MSPNGPTADDDLAEPKTNRTRRAFLGTTGGLEAFVLAGCTGEDSGDTETMAPTDTATATPTATEELTPEEIATKEPMDPDVPTLNYALAIAFLAWVTLDR